jgi:AraC family transcriptional regulator
MIRERFTEQLTLSDIASQAGVHPVHLAREYRKYYRSTVGEQIRRLRIDYARQQISTTENTIADIALTSGFSDQSPFTLAFKSYVGSPPSVYRRALRLSGKTAPPLD